MNLNKHRIGFAIALAAAATGVSTPASAQGCNGVVNVFVWGCAPWDNNNGAKFPYYKKHAVTIPAGQAVIERTKEGNYVATYQGQKMPLISQDGGGLVASGAGNLVASGAGNLQVWAQN